MASTKSYTTVTVTPEIQVQPVTNVSVNLPAPAPVASAPATPVPALQTLQPIYLNGALGEGSQKQTNQGIEALSSPGPGLNPVYLMMAAIALFVVWRTT